MSESVIRIIIIIIIWCRVRVVKLVTQRISIPAAQVQLLPRDSHKKYLIKKPPSVHEK